MTVKIKSGINNSCQKYDGFRVITHDPHICTQNWASQFSFKKEITLVWLVPSCLKSELHQPQAEFISDWSLKKNVMRWHHCTKNLLSSPIRKQLHNMTTLNRSLMKILKSSGARTDPCGTPDNNAWGNDRAPKYWTCDILLFEHLRNQLT